jgi:type VI secretion system secreted protein VgrG
MTEDATALENRRIKIEGPLPDSEMNIKAAEVRDGISRIPELTVEFMSPNPDFRMTDLVGHPIAVGILDKDEEWRMKRGICVSVQYLGLFQGFAHYTLEARPWLWFLKRRRDNRVFQNENVLTIIQTVLSEAGLSGNLQNDTSGEYIPREYCVQHEETDYDFICRLMEEEGIYFFFDYSGETERLILADGGGAHSPGPGGADVNYAFRGSAEQMREDTVFEWLWSESVTTGMVTLDDNDFTKTRTDLRVAKSIPLGEHRYKNHEIYQYPGGYTESELGDQRVLVKMQAIAATHQVWHATSNLRTLSVGDTIKLNEHPRADQNAEYMVTDAVFQYQIETEETPDDAHPVDEDAEETAPGRLEFVKKHDDTFRIKFVAIPKATQYRAPLVTPWPEIAGLQPAVVVGPDDEEIYTDEYGRVKIQFHWDRLGDSDENSSCWVRCMNPWTGADWGMIAVPRIGQEVIVQFEQGDPDRPVIVGALYNDVTMPPYALPDKKMVTAIKTNRYKGGGGFHEFMMDDTKEAELLRMQSERDYKQIIKNNAEITVGLEHQDPGDLIQTIQNSKTETIKKGNMTRTVETGNQDVTVNMGDYSVSTDAGKTTITAAVSIELICGASSIKLEPSQITITSPTVKVDAAMSAEVKGGLSATLTSNLAAKVNGSTTVQVVGGIVTIN